MMDQTQPTMPPDHWQKPMARVRQANFSLLQQVEEENMVPEPEARTLRMRQRIADPLERGITVSLHSSQQISKQPLSLIVVSFFYIIIQKKAHRFKSATYSIYLI